MKRNRIVYAFAFLSLFGMTACEDMLDTGSTMTQGVDEHSLSAAADSMYSVVGILSKVQQMADQNVILGELRGDLVQANQYTESHLRDLIEHKELLPDNPYLDYSSYYAVINNCNYYLDRVDVSVTVSGQKVMEREIAAVRAIRAWTYLQLVLAYKEVPFFEEPILTAPDAEKEYPLIDLQGVCDFFIRDLQGYVNTQFPAYGLIYELPSDKMLFPVKLVLGDLYLWNQQYLEAYNMYAGYLYEKKLESLLSRSFVATNMDAQNVISSINVPYLFLVNDDEVITFIPMAKTKLEGFKSNLPNIFSATKENEGQRKMSPSPLWQELGKAQTYQYVSPTNVNKKKKLDCGDLRPYATYGWLTYEDDESNSTPGLGAIEGEWYDFDVEDETLVNAKYTSGYIWVYRVGTVYLRMAEALNRLGMCSDAFSILCFYIQMELNEGNSLMPYIPVPYVGSINDHVITGIHSRGSGDSHYDDEYMASAFSVDDYVETDTAVVVGTGTLNGRPIAVSVTYHMGYPEGQYPNSYLQYDWYKDAAELNWNESQDTVFLDYYPVNFFVSRIEDFIVDEMALETAFEGHRFYDLMRVAMRRNDAAYLADKVARRQGKNVSRDERIYNRLLIQDNWYLKK